MDETDAAAAAAEAQFDENESDPDLDLCPPASRVGKTFWCQCGECIVQGSKTGTRLLFWLCRVCGESSLSVEGLHVDLQLSRSTCQCLWASSFSYVLLDGVDRLFGHDQAPSKMSHPATSEWKSFVFRHLRFFPPSMDRSVTIVCIFSTHFSVEVAEQPPNKRRWNSSFLVNRWKLTPSFRCLSTLLPSKAQQKTVFSVAVQLGWPCHARCPLDRHAFEGPWNCQDNKLVGTWRQTRRVDVFCRNLPHARNSESRSLHPDMSTSVEVFVRSATDQRE